MASISFPITSNSQAHSRISVPSLLPPQIRISVKKDPQFLKISLKNQTNLISFASKTSSVPQLNPNSNEEGVKKESLYRFFSQRGGTVKVLVQQNRENETYKIKIEVSENSSNELTLIWGTYQSDSSQLNNPNGTGTIKTPFTKISSENYYSEIEFNNSSKTPCYLSFVILDPKNNNSEIKTHNGTNFCVPIGIGCGDPVPLGFSYSKKGNSNFALFSENAENIILCLYQKGNNEPSLELELDRYVNRTGNIWHISLNNIEKYDRYGFRCRGPLDWKKGGRFHMKNVLLDPYARKISDFAPDQGKKVSFAKSLGILDRERNSFNWDGIRNPNLPMEKLVVYRLNVGLFTKEKSFKGLIEKIPHLKQLGVNAILLEPIFSFDERKGPFYPYHFFSPMKQFGSNESLKEMIKSMHEKGIEVILEVSFCNTSEGNDTNPQMISFRGIDNLSYYNKNGGLNCKSRAVQTLILDCLRFWVCEFHIDGFSFVDSNYLLLNEEISSRSALIESIAFDPILSNTKLIADSSSPINPNFPINPIQFPHWKRWAEMNSKFSTDMKSFIKGEGLLSNLATRLCGSGDVFLSRGPSFCFNYVTKNYGLTLVDLVSFNNESEMSWNCGAEGATDNANVLETRLKQIRNILFILFVSIGVPVLNMGDELGYSTGGKIAYNDRKSVNWTTLESDFSNQITQFVHYLTELRSRRPDLFQRKEFVKIENIIWRGSGDLQSEPDWADSACKVLSMVVKGEEESGNEIPVFVGFNGGENPGNVFLPVGFEWVRLVDTGLPFPGFFVDKMESLCVVGGGMSYEVKGNSCVLFEAKSKMGSYE